MNTPPETPAPETLTREMLQAGFSAFDARVMAFDDRIDNLKAIYLAMRKAVPPADALPDAKPVAAAVDVEALKQRLIERYRYHFNITGDVKHNYAWDTCVMEDLVSLFRLNGLLNPAPAPESDPEDVCGFCGEVGADKIPHPNRWPGERAPGSELVHAECEQEECARAHSELSDEQRKSFLRGI